MLNADWEHYSVEFQITTHFTCIVPFLIFFYLLKKMNWCEIKLNNLIPKRQDVNNLKICSQKSGILETNSDHAASFVWIQDLSLEPYHRGIRLVHLLQSIGYFVLHFHMNNEWRIRLICVNMYMNRITVWMRWRTEMKKRRGEVEEDYVSGLNS